MAEKKLEQKIYDIMTGQEFFEFYNGKFERHITHAEGCETRKEILKSIKKVFRLERKPIAQQFEIIFTKSVDYREKVMAVDKDAAEEKWHGTDMSNAKIIDSTDRFDIVQIKTEDEEYE